MNDKRILTVNCPKCSTTLQVKTRSVEKTIACPKCQAALTVSAVAAPEPLPFAVRLDAPLGSLPMAEPLTLPYAQPVAASHRCSPRQLTIAGGFGGAVLVAAVLLIVFRPGAGQPVESSGQSSAESKTQHGGAAIDPVPDQETTLASQPVEDTEKGAEVVGQTQSEQAVTEQGENYFEALSKAQIKQGLNNTANQGGNGFPSGGFRNLTPRDQARNWDLQNAGRLGAMGLKKVQVPRR